MASREQLFHLLAEAAELEHNILCSYLYAVFSLKQRLNEDLTVAEMELVGRWREQLMGLCVEEMTHLAQVSNLLVAVGSRPHFTRPNLPTPPGYHPSGIALGLSPFDMETLDHFIFLERPEEANLNDGEPFARPDGFMPREQPPFVPLMPRAPDYATIGEFYAQLRVQMEEAATALGEARLFLDSADYQIHAEDIGAKELIVIVDIESARRAIDLIVEQGEGARGQRDESHFGKFQAMKEEFNTLSAARCAFAPCRNVARNPVMHAPVEEGRVHVDGQQAAPVLDAANAAYALMLRCLAKVYEAPRSNAALRAALLKGAMVSMKAVSALGMALTELPARDGEDVRAGMSFAMLRSVEGAWREGEAATLGERFIEIAQRLVRLDIGADIAGSLAQALSGTQLALWAAEETAPQD